MQLLWIVTCHLKLVTVTRTGDNQKTLAILGVLCALPVLSQAAVTYEHEWKAGSAKSVAHTLEAPAGKYRLDIQTSITTPIAVYSGFKGNKAAPLIQLNQGKQGSAEIELRSTKPTSVLLCTDYVA